MEAIIKGDSPYAPKTEYEKEQVAKGLVLFQGKWVTPAKREKAIEKHIKKRKAEIADEESHRLWRNRRKERTKHFDFEYTVPQHVFEHYRDLMEAYYNSFSKSWKVSQKALGRLKVCFYIDRDTFSQIGGAGAGTAAYFRFVPPMELNFFYDRLDAQFTEDVMFHETNHYLTKLLNVDFMYPHFPGESLAEYYGASDYNSKSKKIISGLLQEGRLTEIQTDIAGDKILALEKMIKSERMYEHYNWGWSFVHFLMNNSKYKKKFQKFAIGLAKGKDVERIAAGRGLKAVKGEEILRAFKKYMGLKKDQDLQRLETEWLAYVKDKLKLVTPRGKEKAAASAMATYPTRPIRAKRLYKEAIEEGSKNPITFHKYAGLLLDDDKIDEALDNWKKAIKLDPLNAQFYAKMGRALSKKSAKENKAERARLKAEAAQLLRLAIEIDPDYAWSIESQLQRLLEGKDS